MLAPSILPIICSTPKYIKKHIGITYTNINVRPKKHSLISNADLGTCLVCKTQLERDSFDINYTTGFVKNESSILITWKVAGTVPSSAENIES